MVTKTGRTLDCVVYNHWKFWATLDRCHALERCQESQPVEWRAPTYVLIECEDEDIHVSVQQNCAWNL